MYKTRKVNGKWQIARPSTMKQEYHGNGENAWNGHTDNINGHMEYVYKTSTRALPVSHYILADEEFTEEQARDAIEESTDCQVEFVEFDRAVAEFYGFNYCAIFHATEVE